MPRGAAAELAPRAVAAFRLRRQRLVGPTHPTPGGPGDLVALCGALAGVQAQVLEGAEHAVALRAPGADVRDALWRARTPAWDPLTVTLPALVPRAHLEQVFASAGRVEPVVLVDGEATATWRFTRRGRDAEVTLRPFASALDAPSRERIAQAAAGLGEAPRAERVVLAA